MNLLHVQHGSGGIDIEHDRQAAQIWYNLAQEFESLATKIALLVRQPGDVAARSRKTDDQASAGRLPRRREYNRNDRCCLLYRKGWNGSPSDNDIDLEADKLGRDLGEALAAALRPAILDRDGATLYPAEVAQPLHKSSSPLALGPRRIRTQEPKSPTA